MKNGRFDIGEKVIITRIFFNDYSNILSEHHRSMLIQVDKIFHIIDGKTLDSELSYNSPLVDIITTKDSGETEYFKFKVFKNGNLHLWFKRMDIVKQLNAVGAGNNFELKG